MFVVSENHYRRVSKKNLFWRNRLNMSDSRGHLYDTGAQTSISVSGLIFKL